MRYFCVSLIRKVSNADEVARKLRADQVNLVEFGDMRAVFDSLVMKCKRDYKLGVILFIVSNLNEEIDTTLVWDTGCTSNVVGDRRIA